MASGDDLDEDEDAGPEQPNYMAAAYEDRALANEAGRSTELDNIALESLQDIELTEELLSVYSTMNI